MQHSIYDGASDISKRRKLATSNGDSTVVATREQSLVDEDTITGHSLTIKSSEETDFAQTLLLLSRKGATSLDAFQTADEFSALIKTLLVRSLLFGDCCLYTETIMFRPKPLRRSRNYYGPLTRPQIYLLQHVYPQNPPLFRLQNLRIRLLQFLN